MPRDVRNPDSLFNSLQYGFSQIAIGQGSRIVTISGQVGWDEQQQIDPDFGRQTLKALENLDVAIRAAGGTLDDIILLHIYIVESVMRDNGAVRAGLQQFFPQSPPATSWIGVPALANPAFLIEIEALAVLP
jgi:enamine deaminase RidA (YjgF/YER057c/UK114 family)